MKGFRTEVVVRCGHMSSRIKTKSIATVTLLYELFSAILQDCDTLPPTVLDHDVLVL